MKIAKMTDLQASSATRDVVQTAIDGLSVTVEAILGAATVKVGELSNLKPGDALPLDSLLGDQIAVRLNGETIAYGELVSLGDHFGVRICAVAAN